MIERKGCVPGEMSFGELTEHAIGRRCIRVFIQDVAVTSDVSKSIVMFTYMRSGSSFTAEIFNQNPEAFYW